MRSCAKDQGAKHLGVFLLLRHRSAIIDILTKVICFNTRWDRRVLNKILYQYIRLLSAIPQRALIMRKKYTFLFFSLSPFSSGSLHSVFLSSSVFLGSQSPCFPMFRDAQVAQRRHWTLSTDIALRRWTTYGSVQRADRLLRGEPCDFGRSSLHAREPQG